VDVQVEMSTARTTGTPGDANGSMSPVGQGLPPIEPAGGPDQGDAGGVGDSSPLDLTLLIQGELLAQKEILRGQDRGWTQAQEQEAQCIKEKHHQYASERHEVAEQARVSCHWQSLPLGHRWWFLPIVAAGRHDVQSDEDRIFADHKGGCSDGIVAAG
jgi:hypothetical protein